MYNLCEETVSLWVSYTNCSVNFLVYIARFTFLTFTVMPPASDVFCLSQTSDRPDGSWQFQPHICLVGPVLSEQIFSAPRGCKLTCVFPQERRQNVIHPIGATSPVSLRTASETLLFLWAGVAVDASFSTKLRAISSYISLLRPHPLAQNYIELQTGDGGPHWVLKCDAAIDAWSVLVINLIGDKSIL